MAERLVYVAGPYTSPDPVTNTQRAVQVAEDIYAMGLVPIVPHLSMLWHLISPHDIDFWYEYDIKVMLRCNVVYRIEGASTGADREVREAKRAGMAVFTDYLSLEIWKDGGP